MTPTFLAWITFQSVRRRISHFHCDKPLRHKIISTFIIVKYKSAYTIIKPNTRQQLQQVITDFNFTKHLRAFTSNSLNRLARNRQTFSEKLIKITKNKLWFRASRYARCQQGQSWRRTFLFEQLYKIISYTSCAAVRNCRIAFLW